MDYKIINKDFKIPVLGFGTWGLGGFFERDYSKNVAAVEVLKEAINLGYTHLDTAESYGAGHTEELIGKAISTVDRSKLIITDKVDKTHLKYEDVITSCKKSLERLQTTYIDIYLIHAPNPDIPIKETMRALDFLVEQRIIKFIGVSNFSVKEIKQAQKYSNNKIIVNQIPYNLSARNQDYRGNCANMELEIIPYCQKNGIIIMAYRPIERGTLLNPDIILDKFSEKYNKTKAQIAINWLISKQGIITISKSSKSKHLIENLGAIGWNLSSEDMNLLNLTKF